MHTDTLQVQAGNGGGKARLLTLADLDRRTTAYRRTENLITRIENDLGGADRLSTAQQQMIRRAALTGAMLEDLGARWLAGGEVDPTTFATLCNNERRLFEVIGVNRVPREVPDLQQYLSAKAGSPK